MKINKAFLLLTLTLLLLGITYATETTEDTILSEESVANEVQPTSTTQNIVEDNIISKEATENKEIMKTTENKNLKTASKTIDVNDFNTLHNTLTSDTYNTITLNIKSNIKLTDNTILNEAISKLTINGNGKTINGNNQYQFLEINSDSTVTIKNIKIINCYSSSGGAIYNNAGTLNITNSTLNNNTAAYGGAIYNNAGTLNITNSTLNNNTADNEGGAIHNNGTVINRDYEFGIEYLRCSLTITNSTLNNNTAGFDGGAIYYNYGTLTITNSTISSNTADNNGGAIYYNGLEIITDFLRTLEYFSGILTITNSTLNNNTAGFDGGAIYNIGTLNITQSTLNNNTAGFEGGAIYNKGALTINNTTLNNNKAYEGGAIYNVKSTLNIEAIYGGVIRNYNITLNITNSTLNNNTAAYGGAIYNNAGTLNITNSTLNNNTADNEGGAIYYNMGTLTITNSTLNNNIAGSGGAIYNDYSSMTINNSTLNNNTAGFDGGAIYNDYDSSMTINNSTLNNNNAGEFGGAIYNYHGTLTINNTTLNNNNAEEYDGGAIENRGTLTITQSILNNNIANQNGGSIYNEGTLTITQSTLNNNIGYSGGGAISNEGTLTITQSTLNNNTANQNSGAIHNSGILTITQSTLNNNTANQSGGAIYNAGLEYVNITENTFSENKADNEGSAIYDQGFVYYQYDYSEDGTLNSITEVRVGSNLVVNNNTFTKNKAYNTDEEEPVVIHGSSTLYNNTNLQYCKYYSTIYTDTNGSEIINNRFVDDRDTTELYMYKIYNTNKGKTIKVSGKLLNNGSPLSGQNIIISVNNKKYSAVSDKNGYFTVNYTVNSYNNGTVKFKFNGDDNYRPVTNSTTFVVKQPVELYMYKIYNTNKDKTIKVSGKLLSNGNPVKGLTVNITVNGKNYTAVSDRNGYFTVNYTVDSYNNGSVKFRFAGNSMYESCTNTTTFVVKQPVELYMYKIYNTNKGKTIKISGKILSNTKPVKGLTVNITVNNKQYPSNSDKNGYFTVNYTVDSYNNGSVKFRFPGNNLYESCINTTTFVVKQPVSIYMYPRTIETYGKTIKVSGKLLCNGTGVKGQTVLITVNGKGYNATTVGYGYFTINYTINSYDMHKVVYKYAGSSLYESCTNTTTFNIKPLNPISTKIILDNVSNTQFTDTIIITGNLTDKDSKPLANTNLKLTINSKGYTIKTNAKGIFTYNYKTNTIGKNNITISFTGNSSYLESNAKTTFNVVSKQTKIIITGITKSDDGYITVTGKYNDLSGTNLTYTTLTVVADGKIGSVKTDDKGIFEYKFKPTTTNNKINISYQGNQRYSGTSQSTVFNVNSTAVTYSKSTIMSIDNIDDTTKSNTVKITGKYTDKDGTKLTYTPIKININGIEYETKTDGNGVFTYNYKTETTGIHNVSVSYHGNSRYSGTVAKTTFNVAWTRN